MDNSGRTSTRKAESMMNLIRNNIRRWEKAGIIPKLTEKPKPKEELF